MNAAQLRDLARGILPENTPHLTPEETEIWLKGMRDEREKTDQRERKEFQALLNWIEIRYLRDPRSTDADVESAVAALVDWFVPRGWLQQAPFNRYPDFTGLLEVLTEPLLGYVSSGGPENRHWGHSEYAMVAKQPMEGGLLNFHFIEGPYNLDLTDSENTVELEPGARRRVWAWRLKRTDHSLLRSLKERRETRLYKDEKMSADLNRTLLQDFAAGWYVRTKEEGDRIRGEKEKQKKANHE